LKPVIDGSDVKVLRNGRWRGFVLVTRQKPSPEGGPYYPSVIVRPDGKEMFDVPGTGRDGSDAALSTWLRANGWEAN
jgi:hypothetical protein